MLLLKELKTKEDVLSSEAVHLHFMVSERPADEMLYYPFTLGESWVHPGPVHQFITGLTHSKHSQRAAAL